MIYVNPALSKSVNLSGGIKKRRVEMAFATAGMDFCALFLVILVPLGLVGLAAARLGKKVFEDAHIEVRIVFSWLHLPWWAQIPFRAGLVAVALTFGWYVTIPVLFVLFQ